MPDDHDDLSGENRRGLAAVTLREWTLSGVWSRVSAQITPWSFRPRSWPAFPTYGKTGDAIGAVSNESPISPESEVGEAFECRAGRFIDGIHHIG